MKASERNFYESLKAMDRDDLIATAFSEYRLRTELEAREAVNQRINTETHIQYTKLKEDYDTLLQKHDELKELYYNAIEKNTLNARSTFGRSTEALLSLIGEASEKPEGFEDESQEEDNAEGCGGKKRIIQFPGKDPDDKNGGKGEPGKKNATRKSRLKESLKKLPVELVYLIDYALLNKITKDDVYRIISWREHITLERVPVTYYVKKTLTPVITIGSRHYIYTMPFENLLMHHSYASPSILADILYRKFLLGLPFYRQAMDYLSSGVALSRQDIIHWVNEVVPEHLAPVRDHLLLQLIRYGYMQSDESPLQVNKSEHGPAHKGFMWVHSSSELMDCNPIIVFFYEETRGTDHLRNLFDEFLGYIVCDAYVSYKVFAKEHPGVVIAGCLMHCRRYFAEAFFVNEVGAMSEEELSLLPETKALLLIRDIYIEENDLRDLSADERREKRQELVKPKVDEFFDYIHGLADSGEQFSDRMKKAINYALNQEDQLREFLNDGNIPCDNGTSERKIRAYSVGRANWLFADTLTGADVNAIMYSLVETAKANKADVRIYLQYLLECIFSKENEDYVRDAEFLESLMPWSETYRQYEENVRSNAVNTFRKLFRDTEPPPLYGRGEMKPSEHGSGRESPPSDNVA